MSSVEEPGEYIFAVLWYVWQLLTQNILCYKNISGDTNYIYTLYFQMNVMIMTVMIKRMGLTDWIKNPVNLFFDVFI